MDNANSPEYLEKIKIQVIENLKRTTFAPSVQMTDVPRDQDDEADAILDDLDEDENKDKRHTKRRFDQYIQKDEELMSDSEDEEMNATNGVRPQPGVRKRRNRMDYRNLADTGVDSGIDSRATTPPQIPSSPDHDMAADADIEDDVENLDAQDNPSPSPAPPNVNGSNAVSDHGSPEQKAEDDDIPMEDTPMVANTEPPPPAVDGLQNKTPPDSPHSDPAPPSPPAAAATAAAEDSVMEDAQAPEEAAETTEEAAAESGTATEPTS
jgi:histone deacetylase 1/2